MRRLGRWYLFLADVVCGNRLINADMKAKPTRLEALGWSLKGAQIEEELPRILVKGSDIPLA
jgi:hypothetical protein